MSLVKGGRRVVLLQGPSNKSKSFQIRAEAGYKQYHDFKEHMLNHNNQWSEEMKEAWLKGLNVGKQIYNNKKK